MIENLKGKSKKEILKLFGLPNFNDNNTWIYYLDSKKNINKYSSKITIYFDHNEETVILIERSSI